MSYLSCFGSFDLPCRGGNEIRDDDVDGVVRPRDEQDGHHGERVGGRHVVEDVREERSRGRVCKKNRKHLQDYFLKIFFSDRGDTGGKVILPTTIKAKIVSRKQGYTFIS